LIRPAKYFFIALSFLTVVPTPELSECSEQDIRESMVFFPFIGFLIGIVLLFLNISLSPFCSQPTVNLFIILSLFLLSGGIHHDGLADTADAFFSGTKKDRMLEIMKDSMVGPMGAISLVFSSLFFWQLLNDLHGREKAWALICAPVISRAVQVLLADKMPYARPNPGTGALFTGGAIPLRFRTAIASIFVLFAMFSWSTAAVNTSVIIGFTVLWGKFLMKKIGGFTGDTLGAANEIAQIITLLLFACSKQ